MKKSICMILSLVLSLSMVLMVCGATQTITFTEDGTGVVTNEKDNIETALDAAFGNNEESTPATGEIKGYLALGKDLTSDQQSTVLSLLGISAGELSNYEIVYTTNKEEHTYLDKYISSSLIGTRSLSSVLVKPREAGHGVVVATKNINYCTDNMYRNALITAGVTDADIVVVAPTPISGTAALIGALKAYEKMSGNPISQKALDTSLNELVATGELSQTVGNSSEAEEFIAYIKTVIATNDLNTEEEIEAAIRKGMKDLNVTLTEKEIRQTVELMVKIKAMGIDYSVLMEQADDIYAKYKDKIDAGTFTLDDVDLNDPGLWEIIGRSVGKSTSKVGSSIVDFFSNLFN